MLWLMALTIILLLVLGTPEGRTALRMWLSDLAQRLNLMSKNHLLFYSGLLVIGLVMTALFEVEGLRLFSALVPEAMTWFLAFDMALMLDAMVLLVAMGATQKLRAAINGLRGRALQLRAAIRSISRPRHKGSPRLPSVSPRKDCEDPEPRGLVWA